MLSEECVSMDTRHTPTYTYSRAHVPKRPAHHAMQDGAWTLHSRSPQPLITPPPSLPRPPSMHALGLLHVQRRVGNALCPLLERQLLCMRCRLPLPPRRRIQVAIVGAQQLVRSERSAKRVRRAAPGVWVHRCRA